MANILFYAGVVMSVVVGIASCSGKGDIKNGVIPVPFYFLLAAVVAKYLGL